ncbi:MAG: hypothetical protein HZC50_11620 [Nitrospirae bacterium]|nr:hypothetical protein [Nitrospirota bacterium]
MYQEEKTFTLRFTLEASFPDDYTGDEDEQQWLQEWEARIKPQLLKSAFESLRRHDGWASHIRNRGASPTDEIEIVLAKDFSRPLPASLKR